MVWLFNPCSPCCEIESSSSSSEESLSSDEGTASACDCCGDGLIPSALIIEIPDGFEDHCDEPCELDEFGFPVDLMCVECESPCNSGAGTFQADYISQNDANALSTLCSPFFDTETCTNLDPCENAIWLYLFPEPADVCDWCAILAVISGDSINGCRLEVELIGANGPGFGDRRHGIRWQLEFDSQDSCMDYLRAGVTVPLLTDSSGCSFDTPCCGYVGSITVRAA